MTKDEALKLALEALELHGKQYPHMVKGYCLDAITAIKEALAQPEITTGNILMDSYNAMQSMKVEGPRHVVCQCDKCKAQPEQEPVAWMRQDGQRVTTASDRHNYPNYETRYSIPLYTTPLQRKPLTDEQIEEIWERTGDYDSFARAIEAAHGIKGEA